MGVSCRGSVRAVNAMEGSMHLCLSAVDALIEALTPWLLEAL
jgi:hypothetical protein